MPLDATFREQPAEWSKDGVTAAGGNNWQLAEPSEALYRGEWWTVFRDETLNTLENHVIASSPTLAAAAARVKEARAITQAVNTDQFSTIGPRLGSTRQQLSAASQQFSDAAQGLPANTHIPPFTVCRAQVNVS